MNRTLLAKITGLFALTMLFAASLQAGEVFAPQTITKEERCPVCGMYPANYPAWHSQIVFKDGTHSSFDSPIEMFRFVHNMAKYDKRHTAEDIGNLYVPEYEKGGWLEAKKAFFVLGSNAHGPMGSDLPAFASKEAASAFTKISGGEVLTFSQVTPAAIDGRHGH